MKPKPNQAAGCIARYCKPVTDWLRRRFLEDPDVTVAWDMASGPSRTAWFARFVSTPYGASSWWTVIDEPLPDVELELVDGVWQLSRAG
jgi:hypothetical protein